jgi:hypothetical protein
MRHSIAAILCLLLCCRIFAQSDTLMAVEDSIFVPDTAAFSSDFRKKFSLRWHQYPHSPLKATLLSAAFPGGGQIYNGMHKQGSFFRRYWKVPVVYGAMATCIYFIDFNSRQYRFYKDQYVAFADGDPNTNMTIEADPSRLNEVQDQYHRWMDVSYMCLAGVYILQIIDANVDAHLFYYDVGKDLTLQVHPSFISAGQINPGIGLTLGF